MNRYALGHGLIRSGTRCWRGVPRIGTCQILTEVCHAVPVAILTRIRGIERIEPILNLPTVRHLVRIGIGIGWICPPFILPEVVEPVAIIIVI